MKILSQEAGLESFAVSYLAKEIVKELCRVDIMEKYHKLPEFAPEFAAHIVMAIAKVYRDKGTFLFVGLYILLCA